MSDLSKLRLGTAPDSWGVWFPNDPHQVTWDVYLDEIARVGYVYTELGPQGFMPQDPEQLKDELARRDLTVCGGTVFAGLHKGAEALEKAKADFGREAALLSAVGAEYLVHLPEQYTDMHTGVATEGADIDPEQWRNLVTGTDELARFIYESYGVKLVFHPHVDTHVDTQPRIERFLEDTDPSLVNLCLDTGHVAYCEGDNVDIVLKFPERITYVHLKSVDPQVRAQVLATGLPLSEAVQLGVMCEPWSVAGDRHAARQGYLARGDVREMRIAKSVTDPEARDRAPCAGPVAAVPTGHRVSGDLSRAFDARLVRVR